MKKIKLRDLPNYDTIKTVDLEYETNEVRTLKVKLRIESNIPLHPHVLEKVKELLITLLAHSLEDIDRVLNTEVCVEKLEIEEEAVSSH